MRSLSATEGVNERRARPAMASVNRQDWRVLDHLLLHSSPYLSVKLKHAQTAWKALFCRGKPSATRLSPASLYRIRGAYPRSGKIPEFQEVNPQSDTHRVPVGTGNRIKNGSASFPSPLAGVLQRSPFPLLRLSRNVRFGSKTVIRPRSVLRPLCARSGHLNQGAYSYHWTTSANG